MENKLSTGNTKIQTSNNDSISTLLTPKIDNKKQSNLGTWLNLKETSNININKLTFDPNRATPSEVQEINTNNQMVTQLLKKALSSAFRHGLNLHAGI